MDQKKAPSPAQARVWFRDFGYYSLRWTIIVGVLTGLTPVYDIPPDAASNVFWQIKLQQLLLGVGWGFLASIVFTLIQNGINTPRRRPISWLVSICVWVGMAFIGAFATGRFPDAYQASNVSKIETQEARDKSLQKASVELAKQLDDLKARAAREQPGRPTAYVVEEEALKQGNADLAKQTNPAKKAQVAADQFIGFYFGHTRARAEYCKRLGVDISPFVQAFANEHSALYEKSRRIHNRDPHGSEMIETEVYRAIEQHLLQLIADEMTTIAQQNQVSQQQVCQIFAEHATEMVSEVRLAKINPQLYQAMSEAK